MVKSPVKVKKVRWNIKLKEDKPPPEPPKSAKIVKKEPPSPKRTIATQKPSNLGIPLKGKAKFIYNEYIKGKESSVSSVNNPYFSSMYSRALKAPTVSLLHAEELAKSFGVQTRRESIFTSVSKSDVSLADGKPRLYTAPSLKGPITAESEGIALERCPANSSLQSKESSASIEENTPAKAQILKREDGDGSPQSAPSNSSVPRIRLLTTSERAATANAKLDLEEKAATRRLPKLTFSELTFRLPLFMQKEAGKCESLVESSKKVLIKTQRKAQGKNIRAKQSALCVRRDPCEQQFLNPCLKESSVTASSKSKSVESGHEVTSSRLEKHDLKVDCPPFNLKVGSSVKCKEYPKSPGILSQGFPPVLLPTSVQHVPKTRPQLLQASERKTLYPSLSITDLPKVSPRNLKMARKLPEKNKREESAPPPFADQGHPACGGLTKSFQNLQPKFISEKALGNLSNLNSAPAPAATDISIGTEGAALAEMSIQTSEESLKDMLECLDGNPLKNTTLLMRSGIWNTKPGRTISGELAQIEMKAGLIKKMVEPVVIQEDGILSYICSNSRIITPKTLAKLFNTKEKNAGMRVRRKMELSKRDSWNGFSREDESIENCARVATPPPSAVQSTCAPSLIVSDGASTVENGKSMEKLAAYYKACGDLKEGFDQPLHNPSRDRREAELEGNIGAESDVDNSCNYIRSGRKKSGHRRKLRECLKRQSELEKQVKMIIKCMSVEHAEFGKTSNYEDYNSKTLQSKAKTQKEILEGKIKIKGLEQKDKDTDAIELINLGGIQEEDSKD